MLLRRISIFAVFLILTTIFSCTETNEDPGDDIQDFVGTWNVSDQSARINYQVEIISNPSNSAEVLLNNFADLGTSAVGLVVGSSVIIDNQSLGSGYSTSGSGTLENKNKLVISFDLNDGIDNQSRIATFTR